MTRLLQLTALALALPVIALCVLLADEDEPFAAPLDDDLAEDVYVPHHDRLALAFQWN